MIRLIFVYNIILFYALSFIGNCRDRVHGARDDYNSVSRSRSISWSPSPIDERGYVSNWRSLSLRENDCDERAYRSSSPRGNGLSPWGLARDVMWIEFDWHLEVKENNQTLGLLRSILLGWSIHIA